MGEQGDTISKELEESSIELIYEEIKWALEAQRESLSSVEGKATTLTGFSGAMLALLVGSLQDQVVGSGARICIVIAVGLSLVAIVVSILVFWSRRMRVDPTPEVLLEKFHNKGRRETQLQVAVNRVDAFKQNQVMVERTATMLRLAMLIQTISIVSLAFAVVLLLLPN